MLKYAETVYFISCKEDLGWTNLYYCPSIRLGDTWLRPKLKITFLKTFLESNRWKGYRTHSNDVIC